MKSTEIFKFENLKKVAGELKSILNERKFFSQRNNRLTLVNKEEERLIDISLEGLVFSFPFSFFPWLNKIQPNPGCNLFYLYYIHLTAKQGLSLAGVC